MSTHHDEFVLQEEVLRAYDAPDLEPRERRLIEFLSKPSVPKRRLLTHVDLLEYYSSYVVIDPTEHVATRVVIDPTEHVAERLTMTPDVANPGPGVRVFWNPPLSTISAKIDDLVVVIDYAPHADLVTRVEEYRGHGIPARQVVIVGDLRPMPMDTYATLASAGVFLKHIRYSQLPEAERQRRVEQELQRVYAGLLGQRCAPAMHESRAYDYTSAPNSISQRELADYLARVATGEFTAD